MKLSPRGLKFLMDVEGIRLVPYNDQTGLPTKAWSKGATIGYGHLIRPYEWWKYRKGISKTEAEILLFKDLKPFICAICKAVKPLLKDHQLDALIMLAYNIGIKGFKASSALKLINNTFATTPYRNLEDAWKAWNRSQGKRNKGLINRRNAEWNIFDKGLYELW